MACDFYMPFFTRVPDPMEKNGEKLLTYIKYIFTMILDDYLIKEGDFESNI